MIQRSYECLIPRIMSTRAFPESKTGAHTEFYYDQISRRLRLAEQPGDIHVTLTMYCVFVYI